VRSRRRAKASEGPNNMAMRDRWPEVLGTREMGVHLIFTGLEPSVEHKYWCGP
jgi:hypothetical protein